MVNFILGWFGCLALIGLVYSVIQIGTYFRKKRYRFEDLERQVDRLEGQVEYLKNDVEFYSNSCVNTRLTLDKYIASEREHRESPKVADTHEMTDEPEYISEPEDNDLTINERILLREDSFDARIRSMKGENVPGMRFPVSSVAEEHGGVKNLPHRLIDLKLSQLPDVEESE